MFSSSSKATSSSVSGGGGGEFVGVLESLLQTQLGVFVFSNFVIACCAAVAAITTVSCCWVCVVGVWCLAGNSCSTAVLCRS